MVNISTTDDAVIADIEIQAPPEAVYAAITDPAQLSQWWGDDDTYHADQWEIDLRVGGRYVSRGKGKDGKPFEVRGEYLEVDPPRVLVQTWIASFGGEAASVVRWELAPSGRGTRLKMTHSGLRPFPPLKDMYSNGWPRVIGWLKGFSERPRA